MKLTIEEKQMLGRVLVKRRAGLNLTQEKLCAEADIGIRTLQRAEKGDGISEENLAALAIAFGCSADDLIREARTGDTASPEIRLKFDVVTTAEQLIDHLVRATGMLHIGPEGEHPFNEHIGGFIANLQSSLEDIPAKKKATPQIMEEADYILAYSQNMGFRLFVCHYREELKHEGKLLRNPTTLIIAAPPSDSRVTKTPKGLILDYIVDSRRQSLTRILNANLTPFDWMQDQLISRSDGEKRVEDALKQIHSKIRKQKTKGR
jgi:transcriptional regulator with XRE-family HTH domain